VYLVALHTCMYTGGNLKVDHAKLAEVYGPDADAEGILTGRIPPLQVMQPLYTQLNALISVRDVFVLCNRVKGHVFNCEFRWLR
jgi:hypothetical protein